MMICGKIEKLVLFLCLRVWWSTSISIHVKAANVSLKPGDTLNASFILYSKQDYSMNNDEEPEPEDEHYFNTLTIKLSQSTCSGKDHLLIPEEIVCQFVHDDQDIVYLIDKRGLIRVQVVKEYSNKIVVLYWLKLTSIL